MSRRSERLTSGWDDAPPEARRAILAALLAVFVGALDLTVIATILPRIVRDLQINTADIDRYIWIVNAYLLAYVIAIPVVGRISDLTGRRVAFTLALLAFVIGSLWCAAAHSLGWLIAGRTVQGAGGGALLPITMALVGDVLPPARRAAALGLVGAIDTLGWVLGPLWGALIVSSEVSAEPWRWVFLLNVPFGVLAWLAIARSPSFNVRADVDSSLRGFDLGGAALLSSALLLLHLGLSAGGEFAGHGATTGGRALGGTRNPLAAYSIVFIVAAVALGAVFVARERRSARPLMPPALFRSARFSAAMAANFAAGASLIVAMVDVPVVVTLLVDPEQVATVTALMMAPFTVLMALLSFAGGRLAVRLGERRTTWLGLLLAALGYAALWLGLRGGDIRGMLPGLMLSGAGFGLVVAPIGATAIDAAPAADRGIAAGLTLVFRLLGMTVGISALTAVAVNRLQALVGDLRQIVQLPGETTGEFLNRQAIFLEQTVIPLTLLVVRETFLIAAVLALLAMIPAAWLRSRQ
ncbi:MAG TPA: MFS transporter [Thermomicrobiales bacterium]|nr:MFS transporter [Thermomicrobiales bacterium]